MPGLDNHVLSPTTDIKAEAIDLHLPSSLLQAICRKICSEKLIDIENRLWYGQAYKCIIRLWGQLQAQSLTYKYNSKSGQSQAMWTKMNTLRAQIDARIQGLPGGWEKVLKVLNPEDIRGIGERFLWEEEKEEFYKAQKKSGVDQKDIEAVLLGQTSSLPLAYVNRDVVLTDAKAKNLLWIWYLSGKGDDNKELEASLCVEWCRARARAWHTREEVLLVDEEMRRSIEYCYWKSQWWVVQIGRQEAIALWHVEGLQAYAMDQASSEFARGQSWSTCLLPIRQRANAILQWIDKLAYSLETYLCASVKLTPMESLDLKDQSLDTYVSSI
ncbi:hypothetical protein Moror_3717 [Moniliophthora roreri MCA 2997]|uniref:Uncharacterized protein n=2 Tax=Moniliophthora roreri TaxID=221103 RepID=V2W3J9_MONRO|nr:hypothetical protein Moror_3717 [Moniliophthora roreri MCA 2997]